MVEVDQFRADAIANSVGQHAGIVGEPGHGGRRGYVEGLDDVLPIASFSTPTRAGHSEPQTADERPTLPDR